MRISCCSYVVEDWYPQSVYHYTASSSTNQVTYLTTRYKNLELLIFHHCLDRYLYQIFQAIHNTHFLYSINIGGTATRTNNEDYALSSQAVLFQVNGPTTQNVTITTTEDTKLEETETITLSLAPVQNHVVAGGISTTTISIIDDDGNYTISYLCIIHFYHTCTLHILYYIYSEYISSSHWQKSHLVASDTLPSC